MDLTTAPVSFAHLATGFGVSRHDVATEDELAAAQNAAFATPGPHLLDVRIDGSVTADVTAMRRASHGS